MELVEEDLKKSGDKFLNGSDRLTALDILVYPHMIRNIWFKDTVYGSIFHFTKTERFKHVIAYCERIYNDPKLKPILTIKSGYLH